MKQNLFLNLGLLIFLLLPVASTAHDPVRGVFANRGIRPLLMQGTKSAKQSEKERKEKEKIAEKQRKQAEKEQRRLASEEPVIEYDKFSDVTKVHSQPIFLTNAIFGAPPKTLLESVFHVNTFRVVAVVFYKGQQTTSPNSVTLVFNAQSEYNWFRNDRELVFLADGNRFNLGRTEYWEGLAARGNANEFIAVEIPFSTFAQIMQSKSVEFRLGSQSFSMYDVTAFCRVLPEMPVQEKTNAPAAEQLGPTLAGYNRIETGMSYEEVVRILGTEGVESIRSESGVLQIVMYQWKTERPFRFLSATFENGKLIGKSQIGLESASSPVPTASPTPQPPQSAPSVASSGELTNIVGVWALKIKGAKGKVFSGTLALKRDGNALVGTFQLGNSHTLPLTEVRLDNGKLTAVGVEPSSNVPPVTPGGSVTYQGTVINNRMKGTLDLKGNDGQRGLFPFDGNRVP